MNIRNGRTELTLDEMGSIIGVADTTTGHSYFEANEVDRRLFQLTVPSSTWASRSIVSHECQPPEITETDDGYLLCYENMELDGRKSGISAEVCFRTPAGTDEVQLSLHVSNHGNETVTGVTFPWFNGWQASDDPSVDQIMLGPNIHADVSEFPEKCWAWANGAFGQEKTASYPTQSMLPWADISGEKGGVSCINYQKEPRQFYVAAKNMAGHDPGQRIGILFGFYAYVPPGTDWKSPAMGISVHDADWHRTADRYREWVDGEKFVFSHNRELRESIGSQQVFFSYFDGTPVHPYESLPEIAAFGRTCGVRELCVWDRESLSTCGSVCSGTNDLLCYDAESQKRISVAVRQAVAEGTDVSALTNFRLIATSLDVFREENLKDEVQVALDGSAKFENWSFSLLPGGFKTPYFGPNCNMFSPFSVKYRQRVSEQFQRYLDLGYTSLFYDQPFEYFPDYSRKDNGGVPEMTYAETLTLVKDVRQELRKKNPDALIMGEQCDMFGSEIIDQWMTWRWSNLDFESAVRMHYAFPQTVINCVVDREFGLASHAFAAGLHLFMMTKAGTGTLSDAPEFAEHIGKLAALRKRCAERTVHARFCDKLGLSAKTDDDIVAYSYESDKGPAVIIAAPEKAGTVQVNMDRSSFAATRSSNKGQLFRLDGSVADVSGDSPTFELSKHEVLIWVIA